MNRKWIGKLFFILVILALRVLPSDTSVWARDNFAVEHPNWKSIYQDRSVQVQKYIKETSKGYSWFAYSAHGAGAGTPLILLKLFPELAPDVWGPPEERFSRFGFFDTTDTSNRPLPLGLGWVQDPVNGDKDPPKVHRVTLTCAACHIGRIRKVGEINPLTLVGGPNTEIDVRKYRHALHLTVEKLLSPEFLVLTTNRIQALIESKSANYFFGGYYGIDQYAEKAERKYFSENAKQILTEFAKGVSLDKIVLEKQMKTSYSLPNAPPLRGGSPGQSDGTGDLLPKLLLNREIAASLEHGLNNFNSGDFPELVKCLATTTDNPSVWNQRDRLFGQFDGSVPVPMIRNIAAEVAVVGGSNGVNVINADICASFTARLPSPPFPFDVDIVKAERGRKIFDRNCQICHSTRNSKIYGPGDIGTNPNRARVQTPEGRKLFLDTFTRAIPDLYIISNPDGSQLKASTLKERPDDVLGSRNHPNKQGYVADPLDGIWARAPYLHNGSVPTLRHLLASENPDSLRPTAFFRGSIDYDQHNVGFAWQVLDSALLRQNSPSSAIFDTRWDGASSGGHDRNIVIDGVERRLNFSGPEHRIDLEDLIEYLKTL